MGERGSGHDHLGGPAFDADGHYYEPYDAFTRHLESRFADRSLHVVPGPDGLGRLFFGDRKMGMMKVTQTDYTGAPGSRRAFFAGQEDDGGGWRQTDVINAHDHPSMMDKRARAELLEAQGVEATLLFPSVALAVEHEMHDDVDAMYAALRAFNRWLEEDWGYGGDARFYAAPMISLVDVDQAVLELERVLAAGARILHVRKGPLYGAAPGEPSRDPFWARVAEAEVPVAFHTGDAGYLEGWAATWGEHPRPPLQHTSAFSKFISDPSAPDTFANLILNNLFARFPTLRVMSVENGSAWVPWLLKRLDKAAAMARGVSGLGGPFTDVASEVFIRHVYVCPFFEEDPVWLAEQIGADRVLFGSDWPHPEGLAEPLEFADKLVGRVAEADMRRIMYDNVVGLIGHRR